MDELASSKRLCFVAAGRIAQKHPNSSFCLHPETWSLPSGRYFQTHPTSCSVWPGFFWRCCWGGIHWHSWASSSGLCPMFVDVSAAQAVTLHRYLWLHCAELPACSRPCADSLLPVASKRTRKKMNIPEKGEQTSGRKVWRCFGICCALFPVKCHRLYLYYHCSSFPFCSYFAQFGG